MCPLNFSTVQAWNIYLPIREIDNLLRKSRQLWDRVYESQYCRDFLSGYRLYSDLYRGVLLKPGAIVPRPDELEYPALLYPHMKRQVRIRSGA